MKPRNTADEKAKSTFLKFIYKQQRPDKQWWKQNKTACHWLSGHYCYILANLHIRLRLSFRSLHPESCNVLRVRFLILSYGSSAVSNIPWLSVNVYLTQHYDISSKSTYSPSFLSNSLLRGLGCPDIVGPADLEYSPWLYSPRCDDEPFEPLPLNSIRKKLPKRKSRNRNTTMAKRIINRNINRKSFIIIISKCIVFTLQDWHYNVYASASR